MPRVGSRLPFSHKLMTPLLTPRRAASSTCPTPLSARSSRSRCEKTFSIHNYFLTVGVVVNVILSEQGGENGEQIGLYAMLAFIAAATIKFIIAVLYIVMTALAVTSKRVVGKVGVLKIESLDLQIDKVDNVSIKTPFIGRILRYSTMEIKSTGSSAGWKIRYISNGPQFKNAITEAVERHAAEARQAQAAEIARAMSANK